MEHTPDPEQDAADPVSKQMLGDAAGRCMVPGAPGVKGPGS